MKCARCGRGMDRAAAFVGGLPIGPKFWKKMGHIASTKRHVRVVVTEENQLDLFGGEDDRSFRDGDNAPSREGKA